MEPEKRRCYAAAPKPSEMQPPEAFALALLGPGNYSTDFSQLRLPLTLNSSIKELVIQHYQVTTAAEQV